MALYMLVNLALCLKLSALQAIRCLQVSANTSVNEAVGEAGKAL